MDLKIGGITYPTAPFNGWYMVTEIGVRNFTDSYRYNLLEKVAEAFDFGTLKIIHLIGSSTRRIKLCSLSFF